MKPLLVIVGLLALVPVTTPAPAQSGDEASLDDLQCLQDDLTNLDGELEGLEPGDPQTDEFRRRAERIREETIYLKVKV